MNTATLVYDLQRESIRARSGTGIVSLLAIVSLTIGSAIAFLVAGGTWMFWERAQHVEDAAPAPQGGLWQRDGGLPLSLVRPGSLFLRVHPSRAV